MICFNDLYDSNKYRVVDVAISDITKKLDLSDFESYVFANELIRHNKEKNTLISSDMKANLRLELKRVFMHNIIKEQSDLSVQVQEIIKSRIQNKEKVKLPPFCGCK